MTRRTKVDRVNDKLKGLTKAFKKMNATLKARPELDSTYPAFPEPERCDACGSSDKMNYMLVSVQSGYKREKRGVPAWVCDECGHAHLKPKKSRKPAPPEGYERVPGGLLKLKLDTSKPVDKGYSDKLDADEQVSAEEYIAATIFDATDKLETETAECCGTLSEEDCAKLGRDILKKMLQQFRPDLFS